MTVMPLMSIEEVAAYLQVPVRTLYYWRTHGTGPEGIPVGRHLRYRREAVDAWLDAQAAAHAAKTPRAAARRRLRSTA